MANEGTAIENTNVVVGYESNYLICQRSGFKIRVSEGLKREWNGAWVRAKSWEPRQPLDFLRGRAENQRGSQSPEPGDSFLTTNEVQPSDL